MRFCKIAIDPIDEVQSTVGADAENVQKGERFTLLGSLKHKKLRQNSDGLQVYGEGPKYLQARLSAKFCVPESTLDVRSTSKGVKPSLITRARRKHGIIKNSRTPCGANIPKNPPSP
jgi:hypothetical protein